MFDSPGTYRLFDGSILTIQDTTLCQVDHGGENLNRRFFAIDRYSFMRTESKWTPLVAPLVGELPLEDRGTVSFVCGCVVKYTAGDEKERKQPGRIMSIDERAIKNSNISLHKKLTSLNVFPIPTHLQSKDTQILVRVDDAGLWEYCYGRRFWTDSIKNACSDISRIHHSYMVYYLVVNLQHHLLSDILAIVASYT